jgi:C-methyltransferase
VLDTVITEEAPMSAAAEATRPPSPSPAAQPHEIVWALANGDVAPRALHVVAELGVADHIHDSAVEVTTLASACGTSADGLDRVLRLVADFGIFERPRPGWYRHTEASRLLRSDHPRSLRAFCRMQGLPVFRAAYSHLGHAVRTGSPAFQLVDRRGLFGYLSDHPDEADIFGQAMTAKAAADIAAILGAYDFGRFKTIADIAGGRGHLLRAVLDATPAAEGILFELPGVVAALKPDGSRIVAHAGDFFIDPLPKADAYILMEVLHDWPDPEATAILRAIRQAAPAGARVLVIENVLAENRPDPRGHTLDVIMLAVTGGRERTGSQLAGLLRTAGFGRPAVIDTGGPLRIVEAIAAQDR